MDPGYYEKHNERNLKVNINVDKYPEIKGWDFEKDFDFDGFMEAYFHTGIQASNLGLAVDIIKEMRREKAKIFLGFTSNMVSSGVREAIKFLVKHKKVDVLVTAVGGIEEDFIKILKNFVLGSFDVKGKFLLEAGINRIGNIFVPNDRYMLFEREFNEFLKIIYEKEKETGKVFCVSELLRELGKFIDEKDYKDKEDSIIYWAYKNNIPLFCPSITDGAFGDMVYFAKKRHPGFKIDVVKDMEKIVDIALNSEKAGVVILGGGVVKHHILNALLFREGADYAVYVNTGIEYDASDSGGNLEEAVSWGKIRPEGRSVKVFCDASIAFPLMVEGAFKDRSGKQNKQA